MPKVIIADENEGRRNLLANTLERSGFEVTRLSTLQQAAATAPAVLPEVVLIEGEWASGNVLETCQTLTSAPNIRTSSRIVLLSRITTPEFLSSAAMAGVAEVIAKPVDMNQLIEQIQRHASKQFVAPPAQVGGYQPTGHAGTSQSFDVSMTMQSSEWALPMLKGLVEQGNVTTDFVQEVLEKMMNEGHEMEEFPVESVTELLRHCLNKLVGLKPSEAKKSEQVEASLPKKGLSLNQINKGPSLSDSSAPPSSVGLTSSMEEILERQAEDIAKEVEATMDEILNESPEFIALLEDGSRVAVDPETVELSTLTSEVILALLRQLQQPGALSDVTLLTQVEDAIGMSEDVIEALRGYREEE